MKVFLQYPFKFPDSPYYKYLVENLPNGITFLNSKNQTGVITSKLKLGLVNRTKKLLRGALNIFKIPNLTLTSKGEYDLIHCCHCLSLNKTPWVVDVEHYWNFASSGELAYSDTGKKRIANLLKKDNCKKILAWSEAAKESIVKALGDKEINKKIEVVYPAVIPQKLIHTKSGELTLLFVGRYFYGKGGHHALKVFDNLTQMFPSIKCVIVSNVPSHIKKEYSENKQIEIHELMSQEELFGLFKKADIFFYPGYSDTFGFALLEAMSFGLPIITADGFAKNEIVIHEKNGIIIPTGKVKWVDGKPIFENESDLLMDYTRWAALLIKLTPTRKKMGMNSYKEIKSGKFSIAERNKKLLRIYKECLR